MPPIARYAFLTLTPLVLLILGATVWGGFGVAALVWLTLVAGFFDELLAPPHGIDRKHSIWADRLSVALGVGHLVVLPLVLMAMVPGDLGFGASLALLLGTASFFGQVSHPNAHELIHRRKRSLRRLGAAVYTTVGFGHHVSAHRLVHHRHVGTEQDPNTPLPGEDFWRYLPRAWSGSFHAGLACEEARLERRDLPPRHWTNPYWLWVGGAALSVVITISIAGAPGLLALIALAALTGSQILLSDYIQHYGLQRLELPSGRLEPVGPHHSWNAPRAFTSYLILNAPLHSEHHMHPDRSYDELDPDAQVPMLPRSIPVMAMIALVPPLWHRLMDRRAVRVMERAQERAATPKPPRPRRPEEIHAAARAS